MRAAGPAVTHETKYPALNNDVLRALYATKVPRRLITPTVPRTRETLLLVLVLVGGGGAITLIASEGEGDDDTDDIKHTDQSRADVIGGL